MSKKEATWIAIGALKYVISLVEKTNDGSPAYAEHIAEKKQALEILMKEVE